MAKKILKQRSTNDCAIAAMAMLLGESYANVKREVMRYFAQHNIKFNGVDENECREIAAAFGERVKIWFVNKKNRKEIVSKLQGRRAVLCVPISQPPGKVVFHAVYWDGSKLHDPTTYHPERYGADGARAFRMMRHAEVLHSECENSSIENC